MARFFFHFRQQYTLTIDDEGSEFPTAEDAYLSAFRAAREMWHELLIERQDPRACSFEVVDSKGNMLFTLPFTEVLDACGASQATRTRSYAQLFQAALNDQRRAQGLRGEMTDEPNTARGSLDESINLWFQRKKLE